MPIGGKKSPFASLTSVEALLTFVEGDQLMTDRNVFASGAVVDTRLRCVGGTIAAFGLGV